jgi:transposase
MMGELPPDQNALFYEFCLENYVPQDHLLRKIDPLLDLSELRESLSPYYSHTGRPSIDPEVMLRMLIVGYCYGICSERRLCEEVHLNLAYRWFCRLGLEGKVPDHSTFSENRHGRFRESDVFRKLFESVLARGMAEGLVGGEGFAVDASLVKADASHQRERDDDDDWGGGRAVREYLEALEEGSAQAGARDAGSHRQTRRPVIRRPTVQKVSMPTQRTIWWIPITGLLSMLRQRPPTVHVKSSRPRA